MKIKYFVPLVLITGVLWTLKSCLYRLGCDSSDSVFLGKMNYSDQFKKFNLEQDSDTLYFKGATGEFTFIRKIDPDLKPRRYNDYEICRNLNVKPVIAYGYYEYENLEADFRNSGILILTPEITKVGNQKTESLYLTFNVEDVGSLKARIPITNVDTTKIYMPYGELFTYYEAVELEEEELKNVWVFRRGDSALYYSRRLGVLAFEGSGRAFFRVR